MNKSDFKFAVEPSEIVESVRVSSVWALLSPSALAIYSESPHVQVYRSSWGMAIKPTMKYSARNYHIIQPWTSSVATTPLYNTNAQDKE